MAWTNAWSAMNPMRFLLVDPRWNRTAASRRIDGERLALAEQVWMRARRRPMWTTAHPLRRHRLHAPRLFDTALAPAERLGGALSSLPDGDRRPPGGRSGDVTFVRRSAPTVLSAHGYTACTSGVHYFEPGHECARPHGAAACQTWRCRLRQTRQVRRLPAAYRRVTAHSPRWSGRPRGLLLERRGPAPVRQRPRSARCHPSFHHHPAEAGPEHTARRRVVFAGRIVAPKGIDVLIRAAQSGWRVRRLRRRLAPDRARGWCGGWASRTASIQGLARHRRARARAGRSVGPRDAISLAGAVRARRYRGVRGRPIRGASATEGVRDWLRDGVEVCGRAGDHDALAHALNELLADRQVRDDRGSGSETAAERFTAERHVSELLDAYRSARSGWEARAERMSQTAPPTLMTSVGRWRARESSGPASASARRQLRADWRDERPL